MKLANRNLVAGLAIAAATTVAGPAAHADAAGGAATRTTLAVSSATSPTPAGQKVYLRATVKAVTATGQAVAGTVTFLDGARVVGTAPLATDPHGGQVARISRGFATGDHSLTARYQGNATYATSQSLPSPLHVTKAQSRVVVSDTKGSKPGLWNVVAAVKAVTTGVGVVATGTVTITVDSFAPQTFALNDKGRAHLTLTLRSGSHNAHVSYSGDSNFAGSTGKLAFTTG